ncbi:MAG TPA: O-antigen ligase family protein [Nodosilinea sp.]|nr:O-antigen ligase family protein [Nodosilinea sp.]
MEAQRITFNGNILISEDRLHFFEECFAVFGLMFYAGTFSFAADNSIAVIPALFITLMRYGIYASSLLLLAFRFKGSLKTALSNKWALGLVFITIASYLWSTDPAYALNSIAREFIPMFLFSLYLASKFTIKQQFKIISWTLIAVFLFCVALVFVMPGVGVHTVGPFIGSWKGAFAAKNEFGAHSAITLIVLFMLANYAQQRQGWAFPLFGFCFAAILISSSVTALVLSVVGLFLTVAYKKFSWMGKRSVLLGSVSTLLVSTFSYVLLTNWVDILGFFDRDPTLSTRTLIWGLVIDSKIPDRLYLGYGRGVFWATDSLTAGFERVAYHVPAHSHNGFLDLVLDIGLVGFIVFLVTFSITYLRAARLAYDFKQAAYLWPLIFLSMLVLFNTFESYLARLVSLNWVVFMTIVFSLSRRPLSVD